MSSILVPYLLTNEKLHDNFKFKCDRLVILKINERALNLIYVLIIKNFLMSLLSRQ